MKGGEAGIVREKFGLSRSLDDNDDDLSVRREEVYRLLEEIEIVEPTRPILARASLHLPIPIGTLDAIHLATAMLWRESSSADLVFATRDTALGVAASSSGFRVVGLDRT